MSLIGSKLLFRNYSTAENASLLTSHGPEEILIPTTRDSKLNLAVGDDCGFILPVNEIDSDSVSVFTVCSYRLGLASRLTCLNAMFYFAVCGFFSHEVFTKLSFKNTIIMTYSFDL